MPALVIGSMAPDFVYFFSLGVSGAFTHSPAGIPMYCVPAGLLVYLIYFALIRPPLLAWLPPAFSSRMTRTEPWPLRSIRSVATVLISLAIGASTHIVWDSFTHANTIAFNNIGLLRSFVSIGVYDVPIFKILQQVSSLVGFIVIASYIVLWLKRTEPGMPHPAPLSARQRLLSLAFVVAVGAMGGMAGLLFRSAKSVEHGLFNFVVTGMAGAALAIVVLCLAWMVSTRRSMAKNGSSAVVE